MSSLHGDWRPCFAVNTLLRPWSTREAGPVACVEADAQDTRESDLEGRGYMISTRLIQSLVLSESKIEPHRGFRTALVLDCKLFTRCGWALLPTATLWDLRTHLMERE
eukprot:Blabericola_migrator_1__745@NODE_1186_length_5187_cov_125_914258_g807_i0_p9_GENE_NODE_1186_length_5187_cov_125_914258_g807_i0NODE_1186_length_5187_cov_125_914258_g807_i0_p9_ORF_typecomplete_len108_score4_48_NODE_1186_length_5187_cov_125_914258_g807_i020932416